MVAVLTAAVAVIGVTISVALVRTGRRAATGDRLRRLGPRARWRLPSRQRAWAVHALADAAIDLEPEAACELWLAGIGSTALFSAALSASLVVPAALATTIAGPALLHVARRRARRQFVAAVPPALEQVAAALRGGASLDEALAHVADGRGPLAADLKIVGNRATLGTGLAASLTAWPDERPVPAVRSAAGALALAASVGGRAADAIDGLASSLRERSGAAAEARSLSAQARLSATVVGVAPVAYLAFSAVVDPESVEVLVATGTGRVCLALGLALDGLAVVCMRRIVRDDDGG